MRRSPLTKAIAFSQGLPLSRPEEANRIYVERQRRVLEPLGFPPGADFRKIAKLA